MLVQKHVVVYNNRGMNGDHFDTLTIYFEYILRELR